MEQLGAAELAACAAVSDVGKRRELLGGLLGRLLSAGGEGREEGRKEGREEGRK